MDMSGEYRIEAPRDRVWDGLNDPEVLKQCIPGCEEINKISDTEFAAKVTAKVGPVKAKFSGQVTLSDMVPPESYRITGEGKGGAAGFAKGGAVVRLSEDGTATLLNYEVHANVGGKLAQLGARLISGTAKKMADDFFGRFAATIAGAEAVAAPAAAPAEAIAPVPAEPQAAEPAAAESAVPEPAAEAQPAPAAAPLATEPAATAPAAAPAAVPGGVVAAERAPTAPPPLAEPEPAQPAPAGPEPAEPAPAPKGGLSPLVWVGALVVLAVILVIAFQ